MNRIVEVRVATVRHEPVPTQFSSAVHGGVDRLDLGGVRCRACRSGGCTDADFRCGTGDVITLLHIEHGQNPSPELRSQVMQLSVQSTTTR